MFKLNHRFAHFLTRKPKLVVAIALLLLIPSIIGMAATRVNYDILTYLPPDLNSTKGEHILEEPFHDAATSMLIVKDMPARYTEQLVESIEKVPGVTKAVWLSDLVGIQVPTSMLPAELRDSFFSGDSTMVLVQFAMPGASDETMGAIKQIRGLCNERCFLAGFSVLIKDTKDLVDKELPLYILLAVVLSFIAMALTLESWMLPVVLLINIGLAIFYNFGTNIFLGEISYITKAIAAVLQLGVTMDYSIFLYRRYGEERRNREDKREAMVEAIQAAFSALSGSSTTTIAGFLALCFMRLLLGRDIGIVMAKGVIIGVLTVIMILPSILLVMDDKITKYSHKSFIPDLDPMNHFIIDKRKTIAIISLIMFIPAYYSQDHAGVYYKLDEALPKDMPSVVASNILKDDYSMASTHFVILNDGISKADMKEMTSEIKAVKGIESLISYSSIIGAEIPEFFVPKDIREMLKQDGKQIMMINSSYPAASDEVADQLDEVQSIVNGYDSNAYITGEAALTADLISTAKVDFKVTNYISIVAIFLIVAIVFQSLSIPFILVLMIELAIFINQGIPYFTGTIIPFITPTVIGCVQLGATVDYAILITSRFREEIRSGKNRREAIIIAATTSDESIIASSVVLFCATMGVGLVSKIEIISNICLTLARGALISAAVCIFIIPPVLMICEPVIARTSLNWNHEPKKKNKNKKKEEERVLVSV